MANHESRQPDRQHTDPLILIGVVACFTLSGFAALLYQTAWLRQFSLVFGTSELAVATVLATYMAGLAFGAAVAARFVDEIKRPVLVYGVLEAGIAVSALAVPLLLAIASTLYAKMLGGQPAPPTSVAQGQAIFYLVVGFLVLLIPTGLMGATLPLLTRYAVRADSDVGPRVALLYATNTIGAVAGTLVAGFLLLPWLGLKATVWCGVGVNFLVFVVAAVLATRLPRTGDLPAGSDQSGRSAVAPGFVAACVRPWFDRTRSWSARARTVFVEQPAWILPLILASGFNAFLYEVLWTRLLSHVLGGSIYAFTTMLAAFLTGIALGGAIAGRFAENRQQAAYFFAASQVAIAVLSIAAYSWMQALIPETRTLASLAMYAFGVMLPATLFIGATFPLAVRVLSRGEQDASRSTARGYSWNTVGAIAGAILAGFVLIPALGFEGSIKLATSINLLLALMAFALLAQKPQRSAAGTAIAVVALLILYNPERPAAVISASSFAMPVYEHTNEVYFSVGRSSTVLLVDRGNYFDLRTNGLPEASITASGVPPGDVSEKWLTALPVTARPDARSMLVVGFGGGVALEGIAPSIEDVDVIELEPDVISANAAIADLRSRDPLSDPRVNVVINDARNALLLTDKKYDVIVSQPSHPWTAGASHLFTSNFVAIVREHLNESGVFLQWINSQFVDADLLKSLAATLRAEFPYVRLYQPEATVLMFLASSAPLDVEQDIAKTGRPLREHALFFSAVGINTVDDLLVALALDDEGVRQFSAGAPLSTDDNNLMATRSRVFGDGLNPDQLAESFAPYDPMLNMDSWLYSIPGRRPSMSYLGSRLLHGGFLGRFDKLLQASRGKYTKYLLTGLRLDHAGRREEAARAFRAAAAEDSADSHSRYLAIQAELGKLALGTADSDSVNIASTLSGSAAAVVRGWGVALKKDWRSLAALDRDLANSRVTDPWFGKAAQLRAEWRTKVMGDSARRMGFESIRIIDRALLLSPGLDLYVLRAASAVALQDGGAFVESAAFVDTYIRSKLERAEEGEYEISGEEMTAMNGRLGALIAGIQSGLSGKSAQRSRNVQADMEKLRRDLQTYASQQDY